MKSQEYLEKLWRAALAEGRCPYKGCDLLTGHTCWHLDQYLKLGPDTYSAPDGAVVRRGRNGEPTISAFENIEEMSTQSQPAQTSGKVWALFKRLRQFGLPNHQIGILVRRFGYDMPFTQIQREMGWTTYKGMHKQFQRALAKIKKEGGL